MTGGLSDKNGSFNISEIPLGEYVVLIEFIGYSKKEIGPINVFPGQMTGGNGMRLARWAFKPLITPVTDYGVASSKLY